MLRTGVGDIKSRNVTPWTSVARSKRAPIIFDQTHHAGSDVQRSFAEKKDTVWLCAIPEKEGAGLVDVDESGNSFSWSHTNKLWCHNCHT